MTEAIVYILEVLTIRIDVLSKQRYLLIALTCQLTHFCNDILWTATTLLASCVWHDTIRTELVTAVHNVDPSAHSVTLLRHIFNNVAFLGPYLNNELLAEVSLL